MNAFLLTLGAIVWDMDPAIFRIGSFELRYYGVLFALALAAGYFTLRWRYREEGEDPESATNFSYALIAAVIIGTRLVHCLFYDWERYSANPIEILYVWKGGLASHGAAIGIILTCVIYDYFWRKTPMRVSVDRMAMTIPIAMICVRLGNFFNSEIVGAICDPDSPLAFIFPRYDMNPRYPSQLFEVGMGIIACIVMYGVIYYYKKNDKPRPLGLMISLILVLYFGMRFGVEYFKEYQPGEITTGLTKGQILSIPFFILGLIGLGMCLFGPWKNQNVMQYNKAFWRPELKMLSAAEELEKSMDSNGIDAKAFKDAVKLSRLQLKALNLNMKSKEKFRESFKEMSGKYSEEEDAKNSVPVADFVNYLDLVLEMLKEADSKDVDAVKKLKKMKKRVAKSLTAE